MPRRRLRQAHEHEGRVFLWTAQLSQVEGQESDGVLQHPQRPQPEDVSQREVRQLSDFD